MIVDNEVPQNVFGLHPRGYLVLTPGGRSIVITTAENRKSGMDDAEQAALHKSMVAYSGKYRIEGNDFITLVDVAWTKSGMAPNRGDTSGSKAISSSLSWQRAPVSYFPARRISAGLCGNERNKGRAQ